MSVDIDLSLGLVGTNSISFISSVRIVLVVGLFILEVVKVLAKFVKLFNSPLRRTRRS